MGDLPMVIFSLCILGVRDMDFLWSRLDDIAQRHGVHCAGDTACGFGNTAMVLAEQRMIPRVFAATVRAITAVRSLVAYERGAVGPGKDCGYENPILKAIDLMRQAHRDGKLTIAENELNWLDLMEDSAASLPDDEGDFIQQQLAVADASKFLPAQYGL